MVFWLIVASLYTALHNIGNNIRVKCKAHFEKYAPVGLARSSTTGAVIVSPSSKPKFSLRRSSNSAPSNRVCVFKGHHTTASCPTDSVNSDITGRSGVCQLSNAKASDFIYRTTAYVPP